MPHKEYVILASDSPVEYETMQEIGKFLEQRNIKLFFFDLDDYSWDKCKELIRKEGPSAILSSVKLREDVLGIADKSKQQEYDLLIQTVRGHLESLNPTSELILIDGYVFAKNIKNISNIQEYVDIFRDIFSSTISAFGQILFITRPAFDQNVFAVVRTRLQSMNTNLKVEIKTSSSFHDRFWIVDQKRGFFTGTSLNGIGKRYALCDKMRDADAALIVGKLKRLGLIS